MCTSSFTNFHKRQHCCVVLMPCMRRCAGNEDRGASTEPGPGVLIYFKPLGTDVHKGPEANPWGSPLHSFWCCYGSGVESMAKLADSLFFWR